MLNLPHRPRIIHWHKNKSGVQASVSRELISQAVREGEDRHRSGETDANGGPVESGRWSFCVPVKSDATVPWCIYVGGAFGEREDYGAFLTPNKTPVGCQRHAVGSLI